MLINLEAILAILRKNKASPADIETFLAYLEGVSFAEIARQQGLGRAATQARVSRLRNRTLDEITHFLDQHLLLRHASIRKANASDESLERLLHLYHYDADFRPILIDQFVLQHRQFRHKKKVTLMLERSVFSFLRMSKIRSFSYMIHGKDMANVIRARFPVASNPENDTLLATLFYAIARQKYATILFYYQGKNMLSAPIPAKILHDMFLLGQAFKISTLYQQLGKLSEEKHGVFHNEHLFTVYLQACIQQTDLSPYYTYDDHHVRLKKVHHFQAILQHEDTPALISCMYAKAQPKQCLAGTSPELDFTQLVQDVAEKTQRSIMTVERSLRQSPLLLHQRYGQYASLRQEALQ